MKQAPTPSELRLKARLDAEGIKYQFQSIKFSGGTYRIFDFYLPKPYRLAVEVDGPYHDRKYDAERDNAVRANHRRLRVLRVTNDEVDLTLDSVIARIKEVHA